MPRCSREAAKHQHHPGRSGLGQRLGGDGRTRRAGKGASKGSVQGFGGESLRKEAGGLCTAKRAESERDSCCQDASREGDAGRRRMGPETRFSLEVTAGI